MHWLDYCNSSSIFAWTGWAIYWKYGRETHQQIGDGQVDQHEINAEIATVATADQIDEGRDVATGRDDQ